MTDKVQKIKEWISKEQDGLMDVQGNFENLREEGAFHILSNLDYYIDSLQEEPVSEDLEKAAEEWDESLYRSDAFKAGAKWQEEKDQETIETAIHHAYHNGRLEMKEQMMAKAVDGIARPYNNEIWCILDSFNLKDGNKVKVIVIKEE